MLKRLKIKDQDNNLFFTSDLHIGHNREFIYGPRGFTSVYEHDDTLIHRWNSFCSDRAIVFNLGDFSFNDARGDRFKNTCRRLSFNTMYLLVGNHTSGHRQIYLEALAAKFPDAVKDGQVEYEVYPLEYLIDNNPNKKVIFLSSYVDVNINGILMTLCHYPIISHHKQGHSSWMLSGHSHGNCQFTNKNTAKGFRLDVGVDSFEHPVSLHELRAFFKDRELISYDHHKNTET